MKTKLFILLTALFLTGWVAPIFAQGSATPAATPTTDKTQQLEDLKDRLATKVAELKQSQRMAVFGTIKSVSISTFTVETKTKDLKIELMDDMKVFQMLKGVRTALKTDNLEKGDVITVFGEYDTTLELLKPSVVFIQGVAPVQVSGTVTATNKTDYTITMTSADSKTYTVDFETTTKTASWNGSALAKGGFSTFTVGDIIHVTGSAVAKKENRISASRILDITPQVKGASVSATPSATLAPTKKPTPTP